MASNKDIGRGVQKLAEESYEKISSEKLTISFKYVDLASEEFFIHGLTKKYYELLFRAFREIELSTAKETLEKLSFLRQLQRSKLSVQKKLIELKT